jgi:hypothetical protein
MRLGAADGVEVFPQGLEPRLCGAVDGGTEAPVCLGRVVALLRVRPFGVTAALPSRAFGGRGVGAIKSLVGFGLLGLAEIPRF